MYVVPRYRFERMVADALDDLPDELQHVLDNVVVQVHDSNDLEPTLLGLYEVAPHTERSGQERPDVVSIYRLALCDVCPAFVEFSLAACKWRARSRIAPPFFNKPAS